MKHIVCTLITFFTALTAAFAQGSDLAISFGHPTNGEAFQSPNYLQVNCTESSNTILYAEFFANGQSIGVSSNTIAFPGTPILPNSIGVTDTYTIISANPGLSLTSRSFFLYWIPPLGNYTLTAKATDDQGNTATSDPINVFVIPTPIVSVRAPDPIASPNGPGIFTISRTGDTHQALVVTFNLTGTAQDGADYAHIPSSVAIPAGESSADVAVNPLVFKQGKSKTVSLELPTYYVVPNESGFTPSLAYQPPFVVGSPSSATIYIKANERDAHKPSVRLTQPTPNQLFPAGSDITLTADTVDRDTGVSLVEFFDRTTKIGETLATTNSLPGEHLSFEFTWTNVPTGLHLLRARATDSQGKTQVSEVVKIRILPAP